MNRSRNYPAGLNIGIVVAVLAFFAFIGVALLMFTLRQLGGARQVAYGSWVVVPRGSVLPLPPSGTARVQAMPSIVPSSHVHIDKRSGKAMEAMALPDELEGSAVLVVCEWSKFKSDEQTKILATLENLEKAGYGL